ncbi:MAG: hypothetical protein IJV87_01395 [Clostridia bacterium]|nr:hypothetical protein [Clostridia bacterium]
MSEKERKKRAAYRKNREKWIFVQAVVIIILTLAVLISSIVAAQFKRKYYIGYREGGSIDYNVFLKENEFFEQTYLGKDQSYVASLIDKIIANFSYEIDMDADDVNYRYSYSIKSRLEIMDDTSEVAIFNPERELVNKQNLSQNSINRLNINEIVVLNYDEYNDLANKFLETYDLRSTTSNIIVTLEVDVLSDCDAFTGSAVDTYTSELRIPLTTKTVNIQMTSAVPREEAKMIACTRGMGSEAFKTTAIVLGVVDVIAILLLVAFIYFTRTPDITYTARVKKILSQYKSYIQRINNLFETHGYQIVMVDTFEEMLEIRDTIQAPILMYENADKTCAKFMIPTDSKLLYVYRIEIEGYVEPETEAKPDPTPTTIVKPNITNVVRPVVKVVVNNPTPPAPEPETEADIETIIEEPQIEIESESDDLPEIIATVEETEEEPEVTEEEPEVTEEEPEVIEEETEDIEAIIASIPTADEEIIDENTVEAIDIFWEERTHKTYSYDPDGNVVDKGDIVLVPTRDEHSDKDVVREAEVGRGNYRIDPAELDRPLKKIIGVVRRKAEKIFTAMITPEDEENKED